MPNHRWPGDKRCCVVLSFDVDGETAFLGSPGVLERPGLLSMGRYGRGPGLDRILATLSARGVPAQFFVPGYVAEYDRSVVARIVAAGHPVGHHGYRHEPLEGVAPEREAEILAQGMAPLAEALGCRPLGYRAPLWEVTRATFGLLAAEGFVYDSSLMADDRPYRIAHGTSPPLLEFPVAWALDDWEQYAFVPGGGAPNAIAAPAKLIGMWQREFDAVRSEGGFLCFTMHPQLSGRPGRAQALGEFIDYMTAAGDVLFTSLDQLAGWYRDGSLPAPTVRDVFHEFPG